MAPCALHSERACRRLYRNDIKYSSGGAEEDRTPDLRIANAALSQLSYDPTSSGSIPFYSLDKRHKGRFFARSGGIVGSASLAVKAEVRMPLILGSFTALLPGSALIFCHFSCTVVDFLKPCSWAEHPLPSGPDSSVGGRFHVDPAYSAVTPH